MPRLSCQASAQGLQPLCHPSRLVWGQTYTHTQICKHTLALGAKATPRQAHCPLSSLTPSPCSRTSPTLSLLRLTLPPRPGTGCSCAWARAPSPAPSLPADRLVLSSNTMSLGSPPEPWATPRSCLVYALLRRIRHKKFKKKERSTRQSCNDQVCEDAMLFSPVSVRLGAP